MLLTDTRFKFRSEIAYPNWGCSRFLALFIPTSSDWIRLVLPFPFHIKFKPTARYDPNRRFSTGRHSAVRVLNSQATRCNSNALQDAIQTGASAPAVTVPWEYWTAKLHDAIQTHCKMQSKQALQHRPSQCREITEQPSYTMQFKRTARCNPNRRFSTGRHSAVRLVSSQATRCNSNTLQDTFRTGASAPAVTVLWEYWTAKLHDAITNYDIMKYASQEIQSWGEGGYNTNVNLPCKKEFTPPTKFVVSALFLIADCTVLKWTPPALSHTLHV
jgi:hypothetical protein